MKSVTLGKKEYQLNQARTRDIVDSMQDIIKIVNSSDDGIGIASLLSSDIGDSIAGTLAKLACNDEVTKDVVLDSYPQELIGYVDTLLEVNEYEVVKSLFLATVAKYKKQVPKA